VLATLSSEKLRAILNPPVPPTTAGTLESALCRGSSTCHAGPRVHVRFSPPPPDARTDAGVKRASCSSRARSTSGSNGEEAIPHGGTVTRRQGEEDRRTWIGASARPRIFEKSNLVKKKKTDFTGF